MIKSSYKLIEFIITHTHTHTHIYIYIYREREREREIFGSHYLLSW